ncbi:MAG: iduronate 2-sulfatase [Verrucomicrobiota bacterium]|nr:iduronate 2-sulfatase [Verrucomicrobiota bacterium]
MNTPTILSRSNGLIYLTLSMFTALGCGGLVQAEPTPTQKRPNVLFVISDDLSSRIRPTGYEGVMTPVLDRLAKEATTFQRSYCQYPVCGPSRASFLSGLYPQMTGVLDNEARFAEALPGVTSIPRAFRQAGYWTAAVGKVFHRPLDNPGNDTWDQTLAFDNDEMEVERVAREKFEQQYGPVTAPKNRKAWKEHVLTVSPQTRNQGVKGLGPGFGPTGLRDDQHADGKNARQVAAWINDKANGDSPFMIAVGFHKPHIPFLAPDAYFAKYPVDSIKLSRSPADDWNDIPALAKTNQYLDYGFPALGQEDDARRRGFMQAYYACISFVDAQLGLIIEALHTSGQWENTIIVFVGDHGYHLGEHFMWGKVTLFEESARMPMLVRVPGLTKGGSCKALVEMVDLFPTLAALCGVTPPSNLQGRSFVPLLHDPTATGKEYAYTVVRRGDQLGRAIRFDHWRYTEWGSPDNAELYDLHADPTEFTNLISNPVHAAILARAKALLAQAEQHAKGPAKSNPNSS